MMHTLSELDLGVCHTPPNQASSLAVDVENRHLFWLSGTETDELTISQMEYNSTYCFNERYLFMTNEEACVCCVVFYVLFVADVP